MIVIDYIKFISLFIRINRIEHYIEKAIIGSASFRYKYRGDVPIFDSIHDVHSKLYDCMRLMQDIREEAKNRWV
jgi:hypothetical protein